MVAKTFHFTLVLYFIMAFGLKIFYNIYYIGICVHYTISRGVRELLENLMVCQLYIYWVHICRVCDAKQSIQFSTIFFSLEFIYAQIFLTTDCRCVKILNLFKLQWKINIYSLTVKTNPLQQSIQPSIFEVG